jgi:hypothetical protein
MDTGYAPRSSRQPGEDGGGRLVRGQERRIESGVAEAVHLLAPPQEVRAAAAALAATATLEARDNAERLRDVVKFNREMVRTDGGSVEAVGLDVFVLAADGRICIDYQFIEA